MIHYIRFPDEATGLAALEAAGLLTEDGFPITASHSHALDVIGFINGVNGWHVNFQGNIPEDWLQYSVTPQNPVRVFAQ